MSAALSPAFSPASNPPPFCLPPPSSQVGSPFALKSAQAGAADVSSPFAAPKADCDLEAEEISNLVTHKWWTQVCVCGVGGWGCGGRGAMGANGERLSVCCQGGGSARVYMHVAVDHAAGLANTSQAWACTHEASQAWAALA
jgi:hypothetical protein